MPLRKQPVKDVSDVPSENTEEHDADGDDQDNFSSSLLSSSSSARHKHRRESKYKPKENEMTEEEMMDLALRLSEQEATKTALRVQQEEEAVMKAIEESMVGQTQEGSDSQSLLTNASRSLRSRRKLLYTDQGASLDAGTSETDLNRRAKGRGDESSSRNKKRKRKEGSPLLEMPDLSQTQKLDSPCSSESLSLRLDSPQSSDSTQIEDCQLLKSPVFPSTGCRAEVQVPRLSQDLLDTCRFSGFVLCSQNSWISTQVSLPAPPKSPTFPKSPNLCIDLGSCPKSPVFSETELGDAGETDLNSEYLKSPVFGRMTQREGISSAYKPKPTCQNSGFTFSSQGSLTPSVTSTSCRPLSPVFPKSPDLPKKPSPASPTFPETSRGPVDQNPGPSRSPVLGWTGSRRRSRLHLQRKSKDQPPSEQIRDPQSPKQDSRTEPEPDIRTGSVDAPELNDGYKDRKSPETELASDMTLLWSDEDITVTDLPTKHLTVTTPISSPSPVFPEERPVHQAPSVNRMAAASPGRARSNGRFASDRSLSTLKDQSILQQHSTTEELQPVGKPTVHYYWGVPFCPRGLDPDSYTQVILTQMQVYDRSLKEAQRRLLRKAQWGEPILPQPESASPEQIEDSPQHHITQSRGLRLRRNKLREEAGASPAEEEEEEDGKDGEEAAEKNDGRMTAADDCEVCPETQLDNDDDNTQDLTFVTDTAAELQPGSPDPPEVERIPRDASPAGAEPPEEKMEVEGEQDGAGRAPTEGNVSTDELTDPDVQNVKDRRPQGPPSPDLDSATPPNPEPTVDCPICQGSFPATRIEVHAAYCDGEVAVLDQRRTEDNHGTSLKPCRKRTRRGEVTASGMNHSSSSDQFQEKCYICQRFFPLRDYNRHTELCIRRRAPRTEARGNLLSALERNENRDSEAGPSGSKLQPDEVIDLRDDDGDDEGEGGDVGGLAFSISNSPIRSFTPISEATDCLIDFKRQQRVKRPSQRRR
ncbi:uncharacterized protein uimc1 isoform X2 [Echeneis naucrates]|uniref:uncharacterized protein uimc1 isoform X2 n=1 Tax=Echeneis naucrates TaxID=173247 RepID=UPI001114279F|nr:BRCA1-A complex subunit RAP80 isoform X2 [Echeneis naucrates]